MRPSPGPAAFALLLMLLPSLPAQAQNSHENAGQSATCSGPQQALPLEPVPGGDIDLAGQVRHFFFGPGVEVCATSDRIEIRSPLILRVTCADLINEEEGLGYDFIDRDTAYSLWFHVDPDGTPPVLEIGLYRDGDQLFWLDSGLPICAG